jgi:glycosyltransferase involved in cell wall biosynthesis
MITYAVVLAIFTACVLVGRIVKRRMHPTYLWRVTMRSIIWLVGLAGAFVAIGLGFETVPAALQWVQLGFAAVLCASTFRTIRHMNPLPTEGKFADRDLPSVTIAIPARNETKDLEECLRSAIASDYPKLEIIVLDDCSQQKTGDIIKGFAQDGVRFIPGEAPAKRWLAKNQAYQSLYEHASGDIVLFCGVDIRFGVSAVRHIIYQMLERDKRMVSILPMRKHAALDDSYIQPIRYWWEIALPRRLFNRPAVLSSCWAIYREDIHGLGSFKSTSRSVIPEQYFARESVKRDDYSFLRTSPELDISTAKAITDQRSTALRLRYPQLHKRPEFVYALLMVYGISLLGVVFGWPLLYLAGDSWGVTAGAAVLLVLTHIQILRISDPANVLFAAVTLPVAIITDYVLVCQSMIKYEFLSVFWKQRNICLPVMHVYPSLPRIDAHKPEKVTHKGPS